MPSQIKPTRLIYVLHNLHDRHLSVSQFLILDLNVDKDVSSLWSLVKVLAPKEVIAPVPYLTEFTLLLMRVSAFRKL